MRHATAPRGAGVLVATLLVATTAHADLPRKKPMRPPSPIGHTNQDAGLPAPPLGAHTNQDGGPGGAPVSIDRGGPGGVGGAPAPADAPIAALGDSLALTALDDRDSVVGRGRLPEGSPIPAPPAAAPLLGLLLGRRRRRDG